MTTVYPDPGNGSSSPDQVLSQHLSGLLEAGLGALDYALPEAFDPDEANNPAATPGPMAHMLAGSAVGNCVQLMRRTGETTFVTIHLRPSNLATEGAEPKLTIPTPRKPKIVGGNVLILARLGYPIDEPLETMPEDPPYGLRAEFNLGSNDVLTEWLAHPDQQLSGKPNVSAIRLLGWAIKALTDPSATTTSRRYGEWAS